ncbi:hypothetical protein [Pontibacter sp. BAB1700]|uniref:hypothetical protein n=1 Tax=Pontibacter sp. BAB1700 TaxID=1144253 RepID=UPI00026BC4E8|nr:hypothetical protein [Pontibacter sp. BAB1700]EJF11430.1 hypothetical protein O71_03199 [Pontibacter sp. BAB1700]
MIKLFYPLLALALFTQCQQDESYETTEFKKDTDDLKFGQEALLQQYGQITLYGEEVPRRLIVSLKSIEDSRCPTDVNCVTAGNASVLLRASNSHGVNENITLCIGDCGTDAARETHTIEAAVGDVSYKFTLKGVRPYPGQAHEGEVQKAQLVVEKL